MFIKKYSYLIYIIIFTLKCSESERLNNENAINPIVTINKSPTSVTVSSGEKPTFSVEASTDRGTLYYQWQVSVDQEQVILWIFQMLKILFIHL